MAAHTPADQGAFDFGAPEGEPTSGPGSEPAPDEETAVEPVTAEDESTTVAPVTAADGSIETIRVVRVRPDEPGLDKLFDYTVPPHLDDQVRVGSVVRIALAGRRVGGWVVADDVEPPDGVDLQPLAKVTGWGPPPELLELADWAAWRWAGRPASLLRTATAPHAVRALPRSERLRIPPPVPVAPDEVHELAAEALAAGVATMRLPPAADAYPVLVAAAARGPVLVVAPQVGAVCHLGLRLRRAGLPVALMPDDWARARAGTANVFGSRSAAWAPIAEPAAVLLLDEHDQSLQQEQAPTWHARDVLAERARRLGVPFVMVSPAPTLESAELGPVLVPSRSAERAGWPTVVVIDRRAAPPGEGLFSERLVQALRDGGRVVCVLNRKGRSRLTSCANCGEVATCERCQAAVVQVEEGVLSCGRCGTIRPVVCTHCGGLRMKNLRAGVSRVREELEALVREPVAELTADGARAAGGTGTRVVVGTEAALHQIDRADVVAFLDFDQELLAPRYRAAEEAFSLLVRGARLVGGRSGGGRLLVQTRQPHHEVVQAALMADPGRVASAEADRRRELAYPPATAMALVSGASAGAWIASLGQPTGVEVLGPADGRWLLRAPDHDTLCAAMAAVPRPPGRLRLEVDPLRL